MCIYIYTHTLLLLDITHTTHILLLDLHTRAHYNFFVLDQQH